MVVAKKMLVAKKMSKEELREDKVVTTIRVGRDPATWSISARNSATRTG